ncbi:integral peroxisomal membrane peroxin-domain-containing protein [Xylariaceae sp. FL0594]|nr:integral peroxisomal membrane peroxin-domain-containing protein [Xylariaceae sp. FL0594]
MDENSATTLANRDDPIPTIYLNDTPSTPSRTNNASASRSSSSKQAEAGHESEEQQSDADTPSRDQQKQRRGGIRGRFSAAFKEKTRIQDHLVEKLLAQVVPPGNEIPIEDADDNNPLPGRVAKPNFNLPTMSNNFRRFNARIGVVFVFQARVARLLAWRRPTYTLSFLAVYTFVCLDPYLLLPLLPLVVLIVSVLVPSFVARHPAAEYSLTDEQQLSVPYSARGPPIAPAVTVKPVKDMSRDFFRNMRDLQNSMEDFSQMHDAVVQLVVPRANFSDEALSSALFVALCAACLLVALLADVLPWRLIFLAAGWAVTCVGHPWVQKQLAESNNKKKSGGGGVAQPLAEGREKAKSWVERWVERDVILDSAPEVREVEIFELQRRRHFSPSYPYPSSTPDSKKQSEEESEWEPWLFSSSPYDPLSASRTNTNTNTPNSSTSSNNGGGSKRPKGTRFFEDVLPPKGWEWSEKKWALDPCSRDWVEDRIITGVEIETEGERWVYDILDTSSSSSTTMIGVVEPQDNIDNKEKEKQKQRQKPSWEEGEDADADGNGIGRRRGEWRRRRWVRLVKRKCISPADAVNVL